MAANASTTAETSVFEMKRAGVFLAVLGAGIGWVWLFVNGCEYPICRVIGVYRYRVDHLSEYAEYLAGRDLHRLKGASSLTFSCDALRDEFVAEIHDTMLVNAVPGLDEKTRQELARIGAIGARREGRTLHLTNDMVSNIKSWESEVHSALDEHQGRNRESLPTPVIPALFDRIVLHVGTREEVIIQLRPTGECTLAAKPSPSSALP